LVESTFETCDDGNNEDLDGCDRLCQEESGFICSGNPSICIEACGDGIVNS